MKVRTAVTTASALAAIGIGALVVPAVASAGSTTHTLKFTAVTLKQKNVSKYQFAEADKDVNSKGKIIGFNTVWGVFNPKTSSAHGYVTFVTKGGTLNFSIKFSQNQAPGATSTGKLTGGTGKFKGDTGTLTATQLNKAGTRTAVTITYQH